MAIRIVVLICMALPLAACGDGSSASSDTAATSAPSGPQLQTDQAVLDQALHCTPFDNPDKPPVLLVHGTFTTGTEQYTSFYTPMLVARGFDVCAVTYPDRGLGDMQISAEFVVNALRSIHAETGRQVAMIGHSQGALMPRWALKFWPSARSATQDFVLIAGPNHGTAVALPAALGEDFLDPLGLDSLPVGLSPEVFFQFPQSSNFIAAVNAGDETPGDVDYTSIYTLFDELVQPAAPEPTAALELGNDNPQVANLLLQDICPGYPVEHLTIGTTDPVTFALALDAISNPGPANVERAGGASQLCGLLPIDPAELAMPEQAQRLLEILADDLETGLPDPHLASEEPPLMPYAQDAVDGN